MKPGSVEDTVARLALWSKRAPKGLARVEFDSEFARVRVVNGLRAALAEAGIQLHEINLPAHTPASRLVSYLVEQLNALAPGVVSINGFATAFPNDISLADSLQVFNFHRENLAAPSVCQIWWMPTSFAEQFIRAVPDLNSWFMVRLYLTEVVSLPSETEPIPKQPDSLTANLEDARQRAANLVARFEQALEAGIPVDELRHSLAIPAVNALREAGAEREAQELNTALNRKLTGARKGFYPPRVFISYSHDSREHMDRVLQLSNRLRADGIDCSIDQYEMSPPEGWPRWMIKQIEEADFALIVCTEKYDQRFRGKDETGKGLGAKWEGAVITQELYEAEANNAKFIPVIFSSRDSAHIPVVLRSVTRYELNSEEGYESLYRRLTKRPRIVKPDLGKLRSMPPLERKQDFLSAPWNIPYPRNPFFTGREDVLKQLYGILMSGNAAALTQTQAISGLGGIGKTQTAVEFAYRYRDEYKAVLWARADSRETLISDFAAIASILDLPMKDTQDQNLIVITVKHWLESSTDWMLILDNADDPKLLEEFLPLDPKGRILLTSRAQLFDNLGITNPIALEKMSPPEAEEFFLKRTRRNDLEPAETKAMKQLAQELDYLPLALEQAGAYILAKKARFQDYLFSYQKRGLELLEKAGPVTGKYPKSVATTWSLNFEQVEQTSRAAADLLRVSAFLYPDKIPLELITLGAAELGPALATALADFDNNPLALDEILEPLTQYSLIHRDLGAQTYDIHRLVQAVLKDRMDEATQRLWAERTVRVVNRVFPHVEFSTWPRCERLLPHAEASAKLVKEWDLEFQEAGRLLHLTGLYLKQRASFAQAELFFQRALAIAEKIWGSDHPNVAASLNNLATLYHAQGRYAKAEPLYKQALAIRKRTLGTEHPDVAQSLNNLAELYSSKGKYEEAEPLYKQAIEIDRKILGSEHPELAADFNNLAGLYYIQGRYIEAESLYRQALVILEKAHGRDHPHVATSLNNLAVLYSKQGKHAEAEPLFQQALALREKILGPNHPDTATSLRNYAALLRKTNREAEAAEMEARAKAIRAKHVQENSPKQSG